MWGAKVATQILCRDDAEYYSRQASNYNGCQGGAEGGRRSLCWSSCLDEPANPLGVNETTGHGTSLLLYESSLGRHNTKVTSVCAHVSVLRTRQLSACETNFQTTCVVWIAVIVNRATWIELTRYRRVAGVVVRRGLCGGDCANRSNAQGHSGPGGRESPLPALGVGTSRS